MTRRSHRVPREVLDFFEDGDRGIWSIREHARREHARPLWRPVAKFVGMTLAWAALTFVVLLLWLHH
jgi:hypothetical protein